MRHVDQLIEFAVAAIWGCAAVIRRDSAYELLKDTVEKWVPILLKISNLSDDRVNGAVPVAASNAMALLAVGLTSELLAKFPNLLFDYMDIVETVSKVVVKKGSGKNKDKDRDMNRDRDRNRGRDRDRDA